MRTDKFTHLISSLLILVFSFLSVTTKSYADTPVFSTLTQGDVDSIIKDFAAVETWTSVSPGSSLGENFGFEAGLVFGAAKVPNIEKLVHKADPTQDIPALAHAALLGAISVPHGLKFELGVLPEKEVDSVKLTYQAFAIQWTLTQEMLTLPIDLAVKIHRTTSKLKYTQDVLGTPSDIEIEDSISGLQFIAGKNLVFIEPYAGIGLVKTEGTFTGAAGLFSDPAAKSMDSKVSGSQFFAGLNFQLLIFKFGLEVGKVYESTKASLKLSAAF